MLRRKIGEKSPASTASNSSLHSQPKYEEDADSLNLLLLVLIGHGRGEWSCKVAGKGVDKAVIEFLPRGLWLLERMFKWVDMG